MIDRKTAKQIIELRKIKDFIWNWIHKPLLLVYILFSLIYLVINKI